MNFKSSLFALLVCFGSYNAQAYTLYVTPCEHNPIGGFYNICSPYSCGSTATPYHEHIAGIAGSPLLTNSKELTTKVMDYVTYGGEKAKHAILQVLTENPQAQNNKSFRKLIEQEMKRQQERSQQLAANRKTIGVVLCVAACVVAGIVIYDYFKQKQTAQTA